MITNRFVSGALTVLAAVALCITTFSVTSCKRKGAEVAVTGVTVSLPSITIEKGQVSVISYAVQPANASNKAVSFSSSDPSVASVDEEGRITGKSAGTATVTVTTKDGGFTDTVKVTVTDPSNPGGSSGGPVTGILLSTYDLTLPVGTAVKLSAYVLPGNADNTDVDWKTSKAPVAIVDDYGQVTGIMVGSASVTVTSKSNPSVSAKCEILVVDADAPSFEFVNMGNGISWANRNLGAGKPEEIGYFYAWGETELKDDYSWDSYFDGTEGKDFFYYNPEKSTVLQSNHDVVTKMLGPGYSIPKFEDWEILANKDNYDWTWTSDYNKSGVSGIVVKSKVKGAEGNSIFLPAAGYIDENGLQANSTSGFYWSSSLKTGDEEIGAYSHNLKFNSSGVSCSKDLGVARKTGLSIRPIRKK